MTNTNFRHLLLLGTGKAVTGMEVEVTVTSQLSGCEAGLWVFMFR